MNPKTCAALAALMLAAAAATGAGPPTGAEIIDQMIDKAGGMSAFRALGVVGVAISLQETMLDGSTRDKELRGYVDATDLGNLRVELNGDVVLACQNGIGWATRAGELDRRPLAPRMAVGTIREKLFPLLLPFSLEMDGVTPREVTEEVFGGEPAWRVRLELSDFFFGSPFMNKVPWDLIVRRGDLKLLALEYEPPLQFRAVQNEGVRYRVLTDAEIGGVLLPKQLLLVGITLGDRAENGHVQVVKSAAEVRGPYEPALFLDPERLEALEDDLPSFDRGE